MKTSTFLSRLLGSSNSWGFRNEAIVPEHPAIWKHPNSDPDPADLTTRRELCAHQILRELVPSVNFRGEKRSNETHASTTDPEAKLARKGEGKEAKLSYSLHGLMENRNGLLVDLRVDSANGIAERYNAISMLEDNIPGTGRITVAGDKGYDDATFVEACRMRNVTPHVAQNLARPGGSAIDGRTTQTSGYLFSQRVRKRIEEIFGWLKTVGGFRRTRFRGRARTQMAAFIAGAAYNLSRMERLGAAGP